jgi:NAD(P)-dependent dehydrogenase (short-subunit alcohol dehydrogenase family)
MTGSQTGKVAIVTGGSANLGTLFAQSLASDGANVVVHYNSPRRADEAQAVVNDLEATGVEAMAHQGDLTSNSEIARLIDTTIDRFGRWDILVNTASVIIPKPLAETTEEEYDNSFAINAKAPFFLMTQAFTKMADNGRIINLVTTQVAVTAATYSCYAGSKGPRGAFHQGLCSRRTPVARQIARVGGLAKGQRPFRVHVDPMHDGAEEVFDLGDRIVPSCFTAYRRGVPCGVGYGYIADGTRAEPVVRLTGPLWHIQPLTVI